MMFSDGMLQKRAATQSGRDWHFFIGGHTFYETDIHQKPVL